MVMIMSLSLPVAVAAKQGGDTYKVGVIAPLGNVSVYGIAVKNAAQMAADEINAAAESTEPWLNSLSWTIRATPRRRICVQ